MVNVVLCAGEVFVLNEVRGRSFVLYCSGRRDADQKLFLFFSFPGLIFTM